MRRNKGGFHPLPLAIHKYPSLSRVNDAFILAEIVQKYPLKYNI